MAFTLKDATLSNHFLFQEVMTDKTICCQFLSELLEKDFVDVTFANKEFTFKDKVTAKGSRLDILAVDSGNNKYDIELQNLNHKDLLKRCRYYQALMDRDALRPNSDYSALPESYIIFICTFDYFNKSFAKYDKISYMNGDANIVYDDASHVIFLNTKYEIANVSKPVEEFLSLFNAINAETLFNSQLAETIATKISDIKSDPDKEDAFMTLGEYMQDLYGDDYARAREEGRAEGKAELLNLSIEEFVKLKEQYQLEKSKSVEK